MLENRTNPVKGPKTKSNKDLTKSMHQERDGWGEGTKFHRIQDRKKKRKGNMHENPERRKYV